MKPMTIMFVLLLVSLAIGTFWNDITFVKSNVHAALDPTLGKLLDWNVTLGLLIITAVLNLLTTLLHKYATDQITLKEIKEQQKLVQEEMKLYRNNPEKTMELSKKSIELASKTFPITMRPIIYTTIPFILLLRWFTDYFAEKPAEILGFMSGFWAYIVFFIVWSIVFRKLLKVH